MTLGWVALLALIGATAANGSCDVDQPTKTLLCHVESALHVAFNPCLCSHVVFHNKDLAKEGARLKEKNPRLKILDYGNEITSELDQSLDGVYLKLEKPPTKESLTEKLKELASSLDDQSASKRATAKYEGTDSEASANEIFLELPPIPKELTKHYDVKSLSKYVNFFVVPSDNLTDSSEEGLVHHPSRLMGIDDILNADSLVDLMSSMGAPHDRLIISIPGGGLKFTLDDPSKNMPLSPAKASPESINTEKLCQLIGEGGWTLERDEDMTAPYAYKGTDWIAFDDSTSTAIKAKYVLLRDLGGIAVATSEHDDWSHKCPGRPLVDTLHNTFTNLARKSRAAQLLSLQDQIHNSLLSSYSGDIQLSPYRIVRVVDRAGSVHVVRKEARTEFQCSRQGYFTHPSGCNRFYRCVKFNQYSEDFTVFEYDCPAGLAFDEKYEVCVWPGSLSDASPCKGSSEIAPVPRSRYTCPAEGYYADPENCRWFFACLDHHRDGNTPPTAYEFRCPFGLVFDNEKLACEWPWKVAGGCSAGGAAFASVSSGTLYPGDILEGRLRPAYAQVSDVHVSGGRIPNVNGGLVLGTSLLSGIAGQTSGAYPGTAYSSFGGQGNGLGLGAYASNGKDDGQYFEDNSGAYVHDPSGDDGGQYVHQDGEQVPYRHQKIPAEPYKHQTDGGYYSQGGDDGSYSYQNGYGLGAGKTGYDSGLSGLAYVSGGNGAYVHDNRGEYKGIYGQGGLKSGGAYSALGNNGVYVHDNRGDVGGSYVHGSAGQGVGYVGGVSTVGSAYVASGLKSGGAYSAVDNSGAYVHDSRGDNGGAYVHSSGGQGVSYIGGSAQTGSSAYLASGLKAGGDYVHDNSGAYLHGSTGQGVTYVTTGGPAYISSGLKAGGAYSSGSVVNSGAYVHDNRGDNGGAYVHSAGQGVGYVGGSVSNVGSSYIASGLKTGGAYSTGSVVDHSGAYVHDNRGDSGGEYVHGTSEQGAGYVSGVTGVKSGGAYSSVSSSGNGAYLSGNNVAYLSGIQTGINSGAYVHDNRGDYVGYYGGKYQVGQGAYNAGTQLYKGDYQQYGRGAYIHDNRGDYGGGYAHSGYKTYVPTYGIKVNTANVYQQTAPVIHTYDTSRLHAQQQGYIQSNVHVQPITATAAPVVPLNPVQYIQPAVRPVVVTTPAPKVVSYHYEKPLVSVTPVQKIQPIVLSTPAPPVVSYSYNQPISVSRPIVPISVTSRPVVPLNPVQYVSSTPVPNYQANFGYSYEKPAIKFETPTRVNYVQPVQHYVSTPAPPTVVKTEQIHSVAYNYPKQVAFPTPSPIVVSSTPVVPYNPVRYNVPCISCSSAQTARPITISSPSVNYYEPPKVQPVQPICSTCATAQTARPITVTSSPIVPYSPVQYKPAVSYTYSQQPIKFESVNVHRPVVYSTPSPTYVSSTVRPITVTSAPVVPYNPVQYAVSTPAPPVISYTYQKPVYKTQPVLPVVSTPAPAIVHKTEQIGYSYPKPSIRFEETPLVATNPPSVVSYQQPVVHTQTIRPVVSVSSTPVVPFNPVQYVTPRPEIAYVPQKPRPFTVGYNYEKPVVSYSYQQPIVKQEYVKPVVPVYSTPAPPVVSYSYQQPIVKQEYVKPVVPVHSTPAPPVVSYSYQQPIVKQQYVKPVVPVYSTPAPPVVSYSYQQPIAKQEYVKPVVPVYSTPAPPVVSYSYQQPIAKQEYVKPVVPVYSTPAPPVVSYSYQQPIVKQEYAKPVVPVYSTPAPPVVSYSYQQPIVKQEYVKPVVPVVSTPAPVVSYSYKQQPFIKQQISYSTPAPPVVNYSYRPVEYVKPAQPKEVFSYSYSKPQIPVTPAAPVVSYSYQPVKTPTIQPVTVSSTPVVPYSPVQYVKPVEPKLTYSYNYEKPQSEVLSYNTFESFKTQTVRPVTVTSAPVVPYSPVQYVKPVEPKTVYNYNYVKPQPAPVAPVTPVVSYNYQPVVKQQISVTTPSPVVSYSYQPTVRPVSVSTPAPVVSYNYQPVFKQRVSVSTPAPTLAPIVVTETPRVPYNPVQYVKPAQPIYSYSYEQARPTIAVSTTPAVPLNPVQYNYNYVQEQKVTPIVPVSPKIESKPIFSYTYVRPEPKPAVAVSPVIPTVQYVKTTTAQTPALVSYSYEAPAVQKVQTYYEEKQVPIVTTQRAYSRVRPTGIKKIPVVVTTTQEPAIDSYYQEYFESNREGYEYKKPIVGLEQTKISGGVYTYEEQNNVQQHSSSFAPIIVPEISTAVPYRKKPVQTYVNTVEEENYYSSSPVPVDAQDENLNIHLDIPRVGVPIVTSTTAQPIVQVTTVAPVLKRVRVKGGNAGTGYYVRKQKVKVQPVVTTSENYPAYFTTTVKPVYSSTVDLKSPTLYTTTVRPIYSTIRTSSTTDNELEIEDEEDDGQLIQQVSGGFGEIISSGNKGIINQGYSVSSTTVANLKDGEAIVGVVKKDREPFTGRKRAKVVVVSKLSDFNPILVGKLGAECSCKSDTKTLALTKTSGSRGRIFKTTTVVPSREYLPTSTTPLPAELTNFDYDDSSPPSPVVEIKPVRKSQRVYTTTGQPLDVSSIEYEVSTRPTRKVESGSGSNSRRRLDPDVDCQRPGLFRHPHKCNKFYSCNWDEKKKRYTVSEFNCPIHLAFDSKLGACNWPSKGPACAQNNLLV